MKKILLATFFICTMFVFSCQKNTQNPVNDLFISATHVNINWVATPSTSYNASTDTLTIQGFYASTDTLTTQGIYAPVNQFLVIKMKYKGIATDTLTGTQAIYYTTDGNGNKTSVYQLDPTQINNVAILGLNPQTSIATGAFYLSFVKVSGDASLSYKTSFAGGKFWIALPPPL